MNYGKVIEIGQRGIFVAKAQELRIESLLPPHVNDGLVVKKSLTFDRCAMQHWLGGDRRS